MTNQIYSVETPIGQFRYATKHKTVVAASFADKWGRLSQRRYGDDRTSETGQSGPWDAILKNYFDGRDNKLDDIPCAADGTHFQQLVWKQLRRIPAGSRATYGDVAAAINHPKAARAIGQANNRNPISVIVPCHRVVAASGLGGYGGGLERKRWLLDLEARLHCV